MATASVDVDDGVGEYDECGVCNGPGPTEMLIESITILYVALICHSSKSGTCMSLAPTPRLLSPVLHTSATAAIPFLSRVRLRHGTHRQACWFAKNLRNENYKNGDAIPRT